MKKYILLLCLSLINQFLLSQVCWKKVSTVNDNYLKIVRAANGKIFCSASNPTNNVVVNYLYESSDLVNWSVNSASFPSQMHLFFGKASNNDLYVATAHNGVYKSTNNGSTWNFNFASGYGCGALSFEQDTTGVIYIGVGGGCRGIYVSSNNGTSWANKFSGLDFTDLHYNKKSNTVFACSGLNIYKSKDNGNTWSQITGQAFSSSAIMTKTIGSDIYVFSNDGKIHRSTDGGSTWGYYSTVPISGLASPYAPDLVINSASEYFLSYLDQGIWYSKNGINWLRKDSCIGSAYIFDLYIQNDSILAATSNGIYIFNQLCPQKSKKTVSIGKDTQRYCGADSVKLTATTGFKTYSWNTGKTGYILYAKNTGKYTVTATDSQGCTVYDTAIISVLNPRIKPRDTVVCYPSAAVLTVKESGGSSSCAKPSGTLANGLVGYWPFCGNANDLSGNGNHGSVTGATLSTDRLGNAKSCYSFDGIGDYINCGSGSTLRITKSITISAWIYANNFNTDHGIVSNFYNGAGYDLVISSPFSVPPLDKVRWMNQGVFLYGNSIKANRWYHLVTIFDASIKMKYIYLDGVLIASGSSTVGILDNSTIDLFLGAHLPNIVNYWSWDGKLDDIGIWNRALTQQEISSLYTTQFSSYTWSTKDTTPSISISKVGKNTIWVKSTDGIGTCYDTTTATIQKPAVSIGADTQRYCGMDSVKLTASPGFKTYAWSNGKSSASTFATQTGIISVTATDSLGCKVGDTALVSIQNPRIQPRDTIVCSGNPVDLRTNGIVLWSTGDIANKSRIQTTGTTKVWVSSNDGISTCYDTTTVGISNPKVNIAQDTLRFTACSRDSMKVSVGKGWKSVAWSTGAKDTSIQLKTTGTYAVKVQDNVGCYAYDTTYFINPGKVKVTVLSIDSVNCYNGADGSISSSNTGGFAPVTLAWNDPSKQNTSKATGLKAGSYKLMATDAYGCKDSATATVLQPAQLTITVSSIDSIRCYRYTDGSITVTATGGTQPYAYGWNTGSKTTKADKLGAGTYKVVIQDANGCKDSLTATLQDPPELIARIVSGTMALKGEKLNVSGIATPTGSHTYSWQPASLFGSMSGSQNASISLEKNVTLRLTVTNKNNCISRDSLDITVVQALKDIMPNAFSPNTDGLNEGFGLPDIFEIQEFYVYDRWGGIVFKGNASNPRWDGNIGGVAAPAGSYSYSIVATLKGGTQAMQYSGKVSLIK
jgi:gliding motility-associated-like protein